MGTEKQTMTVRKLTTPLTEEVITDLKAGDRIEITGVLIYCTDAAHKRLVQMIKDGINCHLISRDRLYILLVLHLPGQVCP